MAIEMIEEFSMGTQIKVIGVGGGGGNAVEHMIEEGVRASTSSAPTPTRRRSTARRRTT
jgi:cell division GTPase FtsZ